MLTMLTSNTLTGVFVFFNYCTNRNNNIMEDEEHAIFGCPEYETCRLKYPELFNISENNIKDILNIDDQESISKFLWDIINILVVNAFRKLLFVCVT